MWSGNAFRQPPAVPGPGVKAHNCSGASMPDAGRLIAADAKEME